MLGYKNYLIVDRQYIMLKMKLSNISALRSLIEMPKKY